MDDIQEQPWQPTAPGSGGISEAAFLCNSPGKSRKSRLVSFGNTSVSSALIIEGDERFAKRFLPGIDCAEQHDPKRSSCQVPHEGQGIFQDEDSDDILSRMHSYLREATKAHSSQHGAEHMEDECYTIRDSDLRVLLSYVSDAMDHFTNDNMQALPPPVRGPRPLLDQSCRVLKPNHSAVSSPAAPATTISISEAPFTQAMGSPDGGPQRKQSATMVALVSRDSVTEITWPVTPDRPPEVAIEARISST